MINREADRRRIQLRFTIPDILSQYVPIGELTDIMPQIDKIISISGSGRTEGLSCTYYR